MLNRLLHTNFTKHRSSFTQLRTLSLLKSMRWKGFANFQEVHVKTSCSIGWYGEGDNHLILIRRAMRKGSDRWSCIGDIVWHMDEAINSDASVTCLKYAERIRDRRTSIRNTRQASAHSTTENTLLRILLFYRPLLFEQLHQLIY